MNPVGRFFHIMRYITNHPANAQNKASAILNFFSWQLSMRLLNKKVVVPWVNDATFICGRGETALTGNVYTGLMEFEDMGFLLHALRPNDLFVDVGANVGAFTVLASKVVGAKSYAFEPVPQTFDRLQDQININRIQNNVTALNKGAGNQAGSLKFTRDNNTTNHVISENENISEDKICEVPVTTLDQDIPPNKNLILKMDVEGFELPALNGAQELLASGHVLAIIIELNNSGARYGHSDDDIHETLSKSGLTPARYNPKTREITPLTTYNKDDNNTIYIRNLDTMRSRVKEAPRYRIHPCKNLDL